MKKLLLLIAIVLFSFTPALADHYGCTALTGGAAGALDALDITGASDPNDDNLADGDSAVVAMEGATNIFYWYVYSATGTAAESSPTVIRPDDYATEGNWILADVQIGSLTVNGDIVTTGGIELGHASDTTIARSGAGDITVEGNAVYRAGGTDVADADVADNITLTNITQITNRKIDDLGAADDNTDLNVSTSAHGLAPKLPDNAAVWLDGTGSYSAPTAGEVGAATTSTKIDDFAAADDNTDLNVSTSAHGLAPKLSNNAATWLDGTGAYSAPTYAEVGAEGDLSNEAGLYAALSDVSNFMQDAENWTSGKTITATSNADATPDVSAAATGGGFYESDENGTITNFDDGDDESEFADGDWFIFLVTDASTVIDFSDNAEIEGNAGVDFTGSATQIMPLLFVYENTRWNCVNLTIGMSSPTVLALSAIDMGSGTVEVPNSDTLPGSCTIGQIYLDTDGDTNGTLYICRDTDTWKDIDDDGEAAGGTLTTIKENDAGVGGADIVTLDFLGADFDLAESPDTEIQVVIAAAIARVADVDVEMLTDVSGEGTAATYALFDDNDGTYSFRAIAAGDIPNDLIDSQHYAAASIDNEHLADDAVAFAEMDDDGNFGPFTGAWDFTGGSIEIPNGTDPDVDAAGEISNDTDGANETADVVLRGYDGAAQFSFARKLDCIQATVTAPNDLADGTRDALPIWSNETGMTFTVTKIEAWSGTDDTELNVEEEDADGANNATVDAINIQTDGTGMYYTTETTITGATIEANHILLLDFDDTDEPTWVKVSICGWYNADVD